MGTRGTLEDCNQLLCQKARREEKAMRDDVVKSNLPSSADLRRGHQQERHQIGESGCSLMRAIGGDHFLQARIVGHRKTYLACSVKGRSEAFYPLSVDATADVLRYARVPSETQNSFSF